MNSILLSSMLSLLLTSNIFSVASALTSVKVKLHDAATLNCNHTCSGLVMWTVSHKPRDILAQCNQTSCKSEEGFHMSHDQYLKGDLSLTITDVDYSKRTWYTCECDGEEICDVSLRIEAVHVPKSVHPGESLSMDVSVSDPVEVILNKTVDTKPNTVRLCEFRERELQCDPEYEKRVSFSSSLQLKDLKESDSGVYTFWDTKREVIATYTVKVGVVKQGRGITDIRVKQLETATLPCNHTCSGLVTWTVSHKPDDILAQCNQKSCQSEEGFHVSHDEYLKGNMSLTITGADYSKKKWYICKCNSVEICDVSLRINAVHVHKTVSPGESLSMDVPEAVEVTLNRTGDTTPNTVRLCEIKGREPQCDPEYERRVSFSSSLHLKYLNESDNGVYTIRDIRNEEDIVTYTVTVGGIHEEHDTYKKVPKETGMWVLAVVLPLVLLVLLVVVVQYRKKLQNCLRLNRHLNQEQEMTNQDNPEREAAIQNQLLNPDSSNNEPLLSDPVTDSSNNEPLLSDPVTDSSNNEPPISDPVN